MYQLNGQITRWAASRGNSRAQFALGEQYARGDGVPRNDRIAFIWWEKAALQGHPQAQYLLGAMYREGRGTDPDPVRAHAWWDIAGAALEDAKQDRDRIARDLSPEELQRSRNLRVDLEEEISEQRELPASRL